MTELDIRNPVERQPSVYNLLSEISRLKPALVMPHVSGAHIAAERLARISSWKHPTTNKDGIHSNRRV